VRGPGGRDTASSIGKGGIGIPRATAEATIVLALGGAAWLLYGSVLRLWWTHDDFHHLRYLLTHRPFWYFFDAAGFREFPNKLFTPLLFFSLDFDRRLFGILPYPFYLHHLLVFSLCPALLYGVLRLWLSRLWAAAGAWIFLVGPVTASLAPLLFVRHYIEAVLLATLAVGAWGGAMRRAPGAAAWRWSSLSAALYFAACMAKEIAVPLAVLIPLLPAPRGVQPMRLAERARLAMPHAAALVLYLGLRLTVLGTALGYGFVVTPSGLPRLALELPGKIAAEIAGGRLSAAAILFGAVLAAGVLSLLLLAGRRAAALAGIALLLAALPVLPVSTLMEPRYAVAAWVVVAVAFAAGCATLAARRQTIAVALAVAACVSGLWLNRQDWSRRFARAERMSAENRFYLEIKDGDVLRQPLTLAASLNELAWMKQTVYRRPPGGRWFQDDLYLCLHRGPLGRVWGWDDETRRVVNLTRRIPALRARHCSTIRAEAPLSASFRFTPEGLFWELGPYREGTYRFVLRDGAEAFAMPRSAGFKLRAEGLRLRVRYESPEGWITYSPELQLRKGSSSRWIRPAGAPSAPSRTCTGPPILEGGPSAGGGGQSAGGGRPRTAGGWIFPASRQPVEDFR
jgi:hypothetical protein